MTAAAAPQLPDPGEFDSPKAIRAALLPAEVGDFDDAYQRALQAAADTLSLQPVHAMLENWHRIARQTQADPAAHQRMLRQAERTLRTGEPPAGAEPWNELKAELGLA